MLFENIIYLTIKKNFFLAMLSSMRDLRFLTRDQTSSPCNGLCSLNHWVARKVLASALAQALGAGRAGGGSFHHPGGPRQWHRGPMSLPCSWSARGGRWDQVALWGDCFQRFCCPLRWRLVCGPPGASPRGVPSAGVNQHPVRDGAIWLSSCISVHELDMEWEPCPGSLVL